MSEVDAVAVDVSVVVDADVDVDSTVAVESGGGVVEAVSVAVGSVVEVVVLGVVAVVSVPVLSLTSPPRISLSTGRFPQAEAMELGKRPGLFGSTSLGKAAEEKFKPAVRRLSNDGGSRPSDPDR